MKGRNCHWKVLHLYALYNSDNLASNSFLYGSLFNGATEGLCLVTLIFIDSAPYTAECSGLAANNDDKITEDFFAVIFIPSSLKSLNFSCEYDSMCRINLVLCPF